jgi:hypothetical protein
MPPAAAGCLNVIVDAAPKSHGHGPLFVPSSIQRALIAEAPSSGRGRNSAAALMQLRRAYRITPRRGRCPLAP